MISKADSANLILRLYELRRDPALRDARDWFVTRFHPRSAQEVFSVWMGPNSAQYRMVTTYWDMAASLVNHGAIDPAMFHDANTEHNGVFAKLQPFLTELRRRSGLPDYLANLERLVLAQPDAEGRLDVYRRYLTHKAATTTTLAPMEAQ
ncbi:MAG: hypothetical protein FJ206_02490 [Gemmatimonadetes bacterium]|nr:hypothetical protein [Gemmatimonadota bacterium]